MITIICGTNRPNNESKKFVAVYKKLLKEKGKDAEEIHIEALPPDFAFKNPVFGNSTPELTEIINKKMIPASKLVVIVPEYNGSFPGVLKSFLDCVMPKEYLHKKVALVGISAGRSGNLRGLDHLTGIFHYLGADVLAQKVDIATINNKTDDKGVLTDEFTIKQLKKQIAILLG